MIPIFVSIAYFIWFSLRVTNIRKSIRDSKMFKKKGKSAIHAIFFALHKVVIARVTSGFLFVSLACWVWCPFRWNLYITHIHVHVIAQELGNGICNVYAETIRNYNNSPSICDWQMVAAAIIAFTEWSKKNPRGFSCDVISSQFLQVIILSTAMLVSFHTVRHWKTQQNVLELFI